LPVKKRIKVIITSRSITELGDKVMIVTSKTLNTTANSERQDHNYAQELLVTTQISRKPVGRKPLNAN